ncbi:MAG: acyl carrier protein [Nanoarchaeota archaeon]
MENKQKLNDIDIKKKIEKFIRNNFLLGSVSNSLDENDSFLEKGIIDSTGILELVEYVQETFKIKIEDEELLPDNLDSLERITVFISNKINAEGK